MQQLGNTCLLKMWHTIFFCTIVANEYLCNSCRLKNGKLKRVTSKTCKYMCVAVRQEHSCHLDLPVDRKKTTWTVLWPRSRPLQVLQLFDGLQTFISELDIKGSDLNNSVVHNFFLLLERQIVAYQLVIV